MLDPVQMPKPSQGEHEQEHEQQKHMVGHKDPRYFK
jgi:hypothetical protein